MGLIIGRITFNKLNKFYKEKTKKIFLHPITKEQKLND